jgi:hypothetical protein
MGRRVAVGVLFSWAALSLAACESTKEMKVKGLNPATGHIAGDQTVEIQGENFRTDIGYTVYFGKARAKAVTIRSAESIAVTTPSGEPGAVDVEIRADDGVGYKVAQGFRYEDMAGSVIEGIGKTGEAKQKGNLAF